MNTDDRQRLLAILARSLIKMNEVKARDAHEIGDAHEIDRRELLLRSLANHDSGRPSHNWHLCAVKQLPKTEAERSS